MGADGQVYWLSWFQSYSTALDTPSMLSLNHRRWFGERQEDVYPIMYKMFFDVKRIA